MPLYTEHDTINVSIINSKKKLQLQCSIGKKKDENCNCKFFSTLVIPIGCIDRFFILKSPTTFCNLHNTHSRLYACDDDSKLYLGLNDELKNRVRWYTMISFENDLSFEDVSKSFARRYQITEKFLNLLIRNIYYEGISMNRFVSNLVSAYSIHARNYWLNAGDHPAQLDVQEIDDECMQFYKIATLQKAMKEITLGFLNDHILRVEDAIMANWQQHYAIDASHSTIKNKFGHNPGILII